MPEGIVPRPGALSVHREEPWRGRPPYRPGTSCAQRSFCGILTETSRSQDTITSLLWKSHEPSHDFLKQLATSKAPHDQLVADILGFAVTSAKGLSKSTYSLAPNICLAYRHADLLCCSCRAGCGLLPGCRARQGACGGCSPGVCEGRRKPRVTARLCEGGSAYVLLPALPDSQLNISFPL